MFDLEINIDNTKEMIFSRVNLRKPHYFNCGNQNIEVVNEYNYLGLVFNYNANFNVAKFISKRFKSYVLIVKKIRKMSLPVNVAVKRFNNLVKPVVLYGAEVWGCKSYHILEGLQLRFSKYKLSVNKYTCSNMLYGELGVTHLSIDVNIRMVVYRAKLSVVIRIQFQI